MRAVMSLVVALVLASAAAASGSRVHAAALPGASESPAALREATRPIDQHDDSRVGVQLVVAGIGAGVVVGMGTVAYFLRRKLGLTAYSPEQAAGGGHH